MLGPAVVGLGDSLTFGVGDGTQRPETVVTCPVGWAAHVAHALGARSFTNLAANGVRARDLGRTQVPSALMMTPDLVLMTVGGNDVLRGDFDPDEVREHVGDALARLTRPGREIVLVSLGRIGLFDLAGGRIAGIMARRIDAVNEALHRAAAPTGARVCNGAAALAEVGRRGWHVDRVHPSALGHRALARSVLEQLGTGDSLEACLLPPARSPRLDERLWWLARHGTPWVAKRSRDLIPQVAAVVTHELLEDRRRRRHVIA